MPEQTKTSVSQPQPVTSSGTSTGTSTTNNAKRAPASSQQQPLPRYPPREVPPRFRHQEQKQLLKRGQQLPVIAANLGSAPGQAGGSTGTSNQPVTNGEVPNSSKKQPGEGSYRVCLSSNQPKFSYQGRISASIIETCTVSVA